MSAKQLDVISCVEPSVEQSHENFLSSTRFDADRNGRRWGLNGSAPSGSAVSALKRPRFETGGMQSNFVGEFV